MKKNRVILQDILSLLPKDTYVGIWDCRRISPENPIGFEKHPTPQRYIKISNLPYEKVRYLLGEEVHRIAHTEKGIFIQIMKNQDKVRDSLNNWDWVDIRVVYNIEKRIKNAVSNIKQCQTSSITYSIKSTLEKVLEVINEERFNYFKSLVEE